MYSASYTVYYADQFLLQLHTRKYQHRDYNCKTAQRVCTATKRKTSTYCN